MIGENIKGFRVKKNITQEELAKKLNVTRQAISKWENNKGESDLNMLRNIATTLEVTVEEIFDGDCDVKIQSISKETQPALRFIGKRYNGNESIRAKWMIWKENGWFSVLEGLDNRYGNNYIGAKRIVYGSLEYWIGMFFPPNSKVPEGFDCIDIAEVNLAKFRLQGKAHKVTSFETHNLCLDELSKHDMTRYEDHWCFECFKAEQCSALDAEKVVTMDYKISIFSTDKQCCLMAKCESDDESRLNKIEYKDGNTIVRINEYFSETGRKLTDCIESIICYEGKYNKHE